MSENNIDAAKSKKFRIWNIIIMGLCILPYPLYLLDSYIQILNYNKKGVTIIHVPDEYFSMIVPFFFLFLFSYVGMIIFLERIFDKHWDKSTLKMFIISICATVFISYMMVFVCGSMLAFSKDEIDSRHIWGINSKTYNWSDVDSIETGAEKMPGSKNSPYLNGTYDLHFKDGTTINLWGVYDDGFIRNYEEIKNIVEQNNIKVYKRSINEETREYIKQNYDKGEEDIIFQVVD